MSKSDFRLYQLLHFWLNYWFLILVSIFTIIDSYYFYIGEMTNNEMLGVFKTWIVIVIFYIIFNIGLRYAGFKFLKSRRFNKVIKKKLWEETREDKPEKEKAKKAKNKAIRKSFGLIGNKVGFVAIRMPDDFRSADLLEPQLPQLAEFLSRDYGLTATSWDRIIIRHHEYRILKLKY